MTQPPSGGSLLDAAVARFYDLVLADPRLSPWFEDVDLPRLRRHQAEFLGTALDGGTSRFDLRSAHAGLGIDDAAFDLVVDHLGAALGSVGLEQGHVDEVLAAASGLRGQVVEA